MKKSAFVSCILLGLAGASLFSKNNLLRDFQAAVNNCLSGNGDCDAEWRIARDSIPDDLIAATVTKLVEADQSLIRISTPLIRRSINQRELTPKEFIEATRVAMKAVISSRPMFLSAIPNLPVAIRSAPFMNEKVLNSEGEGIMTELIVLNENVVRNAMDASFVDVSEARPVLASFMRLFLARNEERYLIVAIALRDKLFKHIISKLVDQPDFPLNRLDSLKLLIRETLQASMTADREKTLLAFKNLYHIRAARHFSTFEDQQLSIDNPDAFIEELEASLPENIRSQLHQTLLTDVKAVYLNSWEIAKLDYPIFGNAVDRTWNAFVLALVHIYIYICVAISHITHRD